MKVFKYIEGNIPIIVSMPHAGSFIPDSIKAYMTESGCASLDTDWYVHDLYHFAKEMGVYWLQANYSRYVIDLNRSADNIALYSDRSTTELCPLSTFDQRPIYLSDHIPTDVEVADRIHNYWRPYHNQLQTCLSDVRDRFGAVVLLEAHTIASQVPRFFTGQLPDFNFGTNDRCSCDEALVNSINALDYGEFTVATDGIFKGGYITRNYAKPETGIHTLQLELSQAVYMDEINKQWSSVKFEKCQPYLENLLKALIDWQSRH